MRLAALLVGGDRLPCCDTDVGADRVLMQPASRGP